MKTRYLSAVLILATAGGDSTDQRVLKTRSFQRFNEAGGPLVCFPMRWSRAEEASAFAVAPANSMGLVCFDLNTPTQAVRLGHTALAHGPHHKRTRPAVVPAPWLTPTTATVSHKQSQDDHEVERAGEQASDRQENVTPRLPGMSGALVAGEPQG